MGRPTKMTTQRIETIIQDLRLGMTRTAAAGACDVHYATMARMVAADAEFREAVEKAEAWAESRFSAIVARAAEEPKNWTAAAWWLERRHYEDYARRDRVDVRIDLKAEIRKLAEEYDLDEQAAIAEAEALLGTR